jgi:hypothetical protein
VRIRLGHPDGRAVLGRRAAERVAAAAKIRSKVLFPALKQLALGGRTEPDRLDANVDATFFDSLFDTLPLSDDDARLAFDKQLHQMAWKELQQAIDRSGVSDARRFRAISDAERMFRGCLRKNFPDLVAAETTAEGASA